MRSIWAEIDSIEQQTKTKAKSKTTLSSSVSHKEETDASSSTVLTSKGAANTSDSQVPIQNTENNSQTVSCDVQMDNVPS